MRQFESLLNSKLVMKTKEYTNISVTGNGYGHVTDTDLTNVAIVGVQAVGGTSQPVYLQSFYSTSTSTVVIYKNGSSTAQTISKIIIFYIQL